MKAVAILCGVVVLAMVAEQANAWIIGDTGGGGGGGGGGREKRWIIGDIGGGGGGGGGGGREKRWFIDSIGGGGGGGGGGRVRRSPIIEFEEQPNSRERRSPYVWIDG